MGSVHIEQVSFFLVCIFCLFSLLFVLLSLPYRFHHGYFSLSVSCYAKYYFALRSLVEKQDFRQRYNRMVGVDVKVGLEDGLMVQERTERVKEKALLQLSRSMIW